MTEITESAETTDQLLDLKKEMTEITESAETINLVQDLKRNLPAKKVDLETNFPLQ